MIRQARERNRRSSALVDDDPTVRRALQRILGSMDYAVSPFGSAEDFLASHPHGQYGCLLLDLQLCGLSGLELYARLEQQDSVLPVIFISASPDALRSAEAAAGPESLGLLKPLDAEDLRAALDQKLGAG